MFSLNRLTLREILFSVIATVYLAGAAIYYMYVYTSLKYSVVLDYDDLLIKERLHMTRSAHIVDDSFNDINILVTELSKVADTELRSKFQKYQIEKFCKKYPNISYDSGNLKKQIILNQDKKVLFCLVEKNGCTNIKKLFLSQSGLFSGIDILHGSNLGWFLQKIDLKNSKLKPGELSEYFKMTMVRNPLERLVSAYRHKFSYAIIRREDVKPDVRYSINLQRDVFQTIHPEEYDKWLKNPALEYTVTFPDFIQYVIVKPNDKLDVHFQPVIHLCQPCQVQYDFYNVFKRFNKDAEVLLNKLQAEPQYLLDSYVVPKKTSEYVREYYSQLSQDLKNQLFRDWYMELEFYYHICPEERNSHKDILNIDEDIPIDS